MTQLKQEVGPAVEDDPAFIMSETQVYQTIAELRAEIGQLKLALCEIRNRTDDKLIREIVDEIIPLRPASL